MRSASVQTKFVAAQVVSLRDDPKFDERWLEKQIVAVRDAMPSFFDLLREESHPAVRVVLGHFIFVYIHPYMDGNGRVGSFLMNTMMASGGYPWAVIPVTDRNAYVNALEKASVGEDIVPFADFLAGLVQKRLAGEPLPAVPKASPADER